MLQGIKPTYIEALGINWPDIQASALGEGSTYESLRWENGPQIPTKAEMDAWILEETKRRMWYNVIQAERDRRINTGGYKVGNFWFHSDSTSRIQQLGLVLMGANLPTGIMWKTMSGAFVQMTPQLALGIFQSAAASDQALFSVAENHRAQMMARPDPENFNTFTATPAWPKVFGE